MKNLNIIYLIDDDPVDCFIIESLIRKELPDTEIVIFSTGEKALDKLASIAASEYPNLMFLDINMPMDDGWTFLEKYIQQFTEAAEKSKIYILTSSIHPGDKQKAIENRYVEDIIIKPFGPHIIANIKAAHF